MKGQAADERECIIGTTDAEDSWDIYWDVPSRFAKQLAALAHAWGVLPQQLGAGMECALPLQAVRLTRPRRTTESQRRAAKDSIQKARLALRNPGRIQTAAGTGTPGRG